MYNAAVSYTHYTCFAMISSVLHQCAYYQKPHDPKLTRSMAFRHFASTDESASKLLLRHLGGLALASKQDHWEDEVLDDGLSK